MFTAIAFGQGNEVVDFTNPASIVVWLTPVVALGVTWLIRKASPNLSGFITLLIVSGLSGVVTLVTNWLMNPDNSWLEQFGIGLLAVVINQFYKQLQNLVDPSKES